MYPMGMPDPRISMMSLRQQLKYVYLLGNADCQICGVLTTLFAVGKP
jgi:uncharacterized membrane protein YciS (DUF1049 family)